MLANGIGTGLIEETGGFGVEDARRLCKLLLGMSSGGRQQGKREEKSEASHGYLPGEESRTWMTM